MVSDAMTAPGPNMVSHAAGLRDSNPGGSGRELSSGLSFETALMPFPLPTPERFQFSREIYGAQQSQECSCALR